MWNKVIKVKRENGSTIFNIFATSKDFQQSQQLAKQTAYSLFDVLSRYYNVKTDINLRIVDGPITSVQAQGLFWILLLSLSLGFAASFVIYYVFSGWDKYLRSRGLAPKPLRKAVSGKEIIEVETYMEQAPKAIVGAERKAEAPPNLPTEEDAYMPYLVEEEFYPELLRKESKEKKAHIGEPTEEELKERLNQLLRGEL
jgi:hypothetical protein